MTETLSSIIRSVLMAVIALIGMAMAAIFLVSTAFAVGVLYLIAKLRGKPFVAQTLWSRSQNRWGFSTAGNTASGTPSSSDKNSPFAQRLRKADISDIEFNDGR